MNWADFAEVDEAAVGATADEGDIDGVPLIGAPARQFHVVERFLDGWRAASVAAARTVGMRSSMKRSLVGADTPGHGGRDVGGVDSDHVVVTAVRIGGEGLPLGHGLVPGLTFRE